MESKTPQFDILLNQALKDLVPHLRACKWKGLHSYCEREFQLYAEDIQFLNKLRVPPPNFCPTCRRIKRMTHTSLFQLFKRKCDAPEHSEQMISLFPEDCPFPVFDYKYFIGDEFDPFVYGRDYSKDESPMETLLSMRRNFPVPSFLNKDTSSINNEYGNGGRNIKNGYFTFGCFDSDDVWYTVMARKSKYIMDSRFIYSSDHVYKGFHSENIYKSSFIYFSFDCSDSMFMFDCRNCDSCFGCVNLRNAKYCVWNKQLSKEEYEDFMKSLYPITIAHLQKLQEDFWVLVKSLPINATRNSSVENVFGVSLIRSKNLYDVTESEDSENIRYGDGAVAHQDSMDVFLSGVSSLLYETINVGSHSSNVKFSVSTKLSTNCEFVFNSKNLDNCFMCFGLQDKSYCVLNKQYSPSEYFALVDTIKCNMWKRGEYGDGLSIDFSAQAYNFSTASDSFPLTTEEIHRLGGYVAHAPESNAGDTGMLTAEEISQTIEETSDSIIDSAIVCRISGKPFRITKSELQFYRVMKLPLPTIHPTIRLQDHFFVAPIGIKFITKCVKCSKDMCSAIDPKKGFMLYCEKCYQQEVY